MAGVKRFSAKQKTAMTWWAEPRYREYDAFICDGAVRSGITLSMGLGFFLWAMRRFNGEQFALCGKTRESIRRNLLPGVLPLLGELGFRWEEKVSKGELRIWCGRRENTYYLFGGKDEGSAALIQGITLAGVLLDEVALMPRSFVEQACARCSVAGAKLWFSCNPAGPGLLKLLAVASFFVCMSMMCNAILQANGRAALPIWFIAIGSATKLIVNFILVQMPSVGIKGAPVGTLVCFMLVSVMELIAIKRVTPHPPKYLRVFVKPVVAAAIMGAAARAAYGILAGHLGNTMSVAGGIVVGAIVYAILVLVLRIVSKDDLSLMPKGDKIAKLLHIK